MKLKTILFPLVVAGLLLSGAVVYADDASNNAPVEELSVEHMNNAGDPVDSSALNDRLERLEQQISNITNMNMPQQINELRRQVQELNGKIQIQQHDIQVLKSQRLQKAASSSNAPQKDAKPSPQTDTSAYRAAFNFLSKRQYDAALSAFQDYVSKYPKGQFVPNAQYWMGELYLKRDDVEMASKSFSTVLTQFPESNKVPDAKLKLAIIHVNQGKQEQARREFNAIKHQYPNSTAAQLANIQLQRMKQ